MRLLFHLSGEHPTLPAAEVRGVMEGEGIPFQDQRLEGRFLLLEAPRVPPPHRLAFTHRVCDLLGSSSPTREAILALVRSLDILPHAGEGFMVRVGRVGGGGKGLPSPPLESEIGAVLHRKTGDFVTFSRPERVYWGFLGPTRFYFSRLLAEPEKGPYAQRKPHLRPYFRPGVMDPRYSRCLVNLTRVGPGKAFLDPFCGTGGFLLEAGLMGARVHGCDVDGEAVAGCERNLLHYGVGDYRLEERDARNLGEDYFETFDALATDPPYGISASTRRTDLETLYRETLKALYPVLKTGGIACFVSPEHIPLIELAERAGFSPFETHRVRVHRSLTRKIVVMGKEIRERTGRCRSR
jgi:tRNA (guanine10-N2)-dimethyltransferase